LARLGERAEELAESAKGRLAGAVVAQIDAQLPPALQRRVRVPAPPRMISRDLEPAARD
jgi:hypothetical protein